MSDSENSAKTALVEPAKPKRVVGRPFVKGQSGNPAGRPRVAAEIRELARAHGEEALRTLAELMKSAAKEETRARAAEALLDRAYGRPSQSITGEDGEGPVQVQVLSLARTEPARVQLPQAVVVDALPPKPD
jgi:hypothetical protein